MKVAYLINEFNYPELSASYHDYGQPCWISYSLDNFQEAILMNKSVDKLVSVKVAFKYWRDIRTCQGLSMGANKRAFRHLLTLLQCPRYLVLP
ncbi:hypothetical protein Lwal_0169 [Legionella waltersii]|uniref:Uncharacterized protein n=1 Tax=Legionella waltersii TaxID=66969 RepID=A0A0W1ANP1_9GAMM|nr:hypothetical protein Lwal_0169 [Legionella waltersii]SNU97374.1 Uncharacterised protein [Legionella waltersii]